MENRLRIAYRNHFFKASRQQMINAQMSFRFDCLQTGGVQRFKCSPLFFILINKVTVSVAIKSFQSGDSRRPHSGLFTAHPKIKLFLESNSGDDDDNHYCIFHDGGDIHAKNV